MPFRTWSQNQEMLAVDFNPYVQYQTVNTFASSAARAAAWPSPPIGACSTLDSSPGSLYVWNGIRWDPPWNSPWGLLDVKKTTGAQAINTWTDVTGLTSTLTYVANRRIKFSAILVGQANSGSCVLGMNVVEGATILAGGQQLQSIAAYPVTISAVNHAIPTAGAHTYKVQAQTGSATGTTVWYAGNEGVLMIEDVGPAGAPA